MVHTEEKHVAYFTRYDVSLHNSSDDLWVSFLGKVYDLTPLCKQYKGDVLLKPILMFGGKDISHWFDAKTGDLRTYVDPVSGCVIPYTPHGLFVHVPPPYPCSGWANDFGLPWWKDSMYSIGNLTKKARTLKIVNTLTSQSTNVEVCSEETINDILKRYIKRNAHAKSYTWKYEGRVLDMDKNLAENGVVDDDEDFYELGMDETEFYQAPGKGLLIKRQNALKFKQMMKFVNKLTECIQ